MKELPSHLLAEYNFLKNQVRKLYDEWCNNSQTKNNAGNEYFLAMEDLRKFKTINRKRGYYL